MVCRIPSRIRLEHLLTGPRYWNRYPGVQCDVDSYVYLPLLEELGSMPREKYSFGPEILAHAQNIGKHYGLYHKALFQTGVKTCHWLEEESLWAVKTDRDDNLKARFIVSAFGISHMPKLPGVAGIEDFEGKSFHTSRWDYSYTGGDSTGGLTRRSWDKRVGIIGTGGYSGPSCPETRPVGQAPICFSTHPVVCGRSQQPSHRYGVG